MFEIFLPISRNMKWLLSYFSFPFGCAFSACCKTGDRRMDSMARVTEPLASSSLKVLSFESTLYVLMDGRWRYHERDKSHLGGPAYTGNCFVFSHTLSRSRIRHRYIYRRLRRSRTRKFSYSHRITHSLPSLVARNISYTNHLIYFYVSDVVSYRIVFYKTCTCINRRHKSPRDAWKMSREFHDVI